MTEEHENAVEWLDGQSVATFTLHSGKLKSRIMNLAKKRPGDVQITAGPKGNGGYLVAHVPVGWIKINPPLNLSEDALAKKAAQMMINAQKARS